MLGRVLETQTFETSIAKMLLAMRRLLAVVFCVGRRELVIAIMVMMGTGVKIVCVYCPGILLKPNV